MVKYKIKIYKDSETITVEYDLNVEVGGMELIATFSVWVDGQDVVEESASGNTRFFGTVYSKLTSAAKDASVAFSITSTQGFEAHGTDILRGNRSIDEADFQSR